MRTHTPLFRRLAVAAGAALLVGCGTDSATAPDRVLLPADVPSFDLTAEGTTRSQRAVLFSAWLSSLRYLHPANATRAGYVEDEHCVAVPGLGGMGVHWVNGPLIDDKFEPWRPEVLVYEPTRHGPRLVALEYIVLNVGQDRPMFGDHPFDVGGTPDPRPHWSLHVWLWKHNPSGLFAPFNPRVECTD